MNGIARFQPAAGLPPPPRTRPVVLLVLHRVGAGDLDLYPEHAGEHVEAPNLRSAARLGLRVVRCAGAPDGRAETGLRRLLGLDPAGADGGDLLSLAGRAGTLVLTWLPTRESVWLAEVASSGPRWDVWVPELSAGEPFSWRELIGARPRLRVRGDEDPEGVRDHFETRILARFPRQATMLRYDWEGMHPEIAARHWCAWVGDAFLRALWFALARSPRGTFAVMCHPGPAALRTAFGRDGYRYALEQVDDLVGRLLALREHEAAADMLLVVTGDGWGDAGRPVPAVLLGPGLPAEGEVDRAEIDDLRRVLAGALG